MKVKAIRLAAATSAAIALLSVSGCAADPIEQHPTYSGVVPEFQGPWAQEFGRAYIDSDSDFARAILEDEVVTDQENSEAYSRYRECDAALGIELGPEEVGGGSTFKFPPELGSAAAVAADNECSMQSGQAFVSAMYWAIRTNPDNVDHTTLLIDCLIDVGILERGYPRDGFQRDVMHFPYPWLHTVEDREKFDACETDPLGLLG